MTTAFPMLLWMFSLLFPREIYFNKYAFRIGIRRGYEE